VVALIMIVGIFVLIIAEGTTTFWPRPIDRVTLTGGEVFLGIPMKEDPEHFRREYRVGNRDVPGNEPFRWIDLKDIKSVEQPASAVMLERTAWGIWLGEPQAVILQEDQLLPSEDAKRFESRQTNLATGRIEYQKVGEENGQVRIRQRTYLAEGADKTLIGLEKSVPQAQGRAAHIETLVKNDLGEINRRIEAERLEVRKAETRVDREVNAHPPMLAWWGVVALLAAAAASLFVAVRLGHAPDRRQPATILRSGARAALLSLGLVALLFAALEHPPLTAAPTAASLESLRQAAADRITALEHEYAQVQQKIAELQQQDQQYRALVIEPTGGHFAPTRQSEPDQPLLLSQIVRVVPANALTTTGKLGVYFSRWWEYLSTDPRDANTEGGVLPVIFGTVTLTLLLSIVVVPLGVVAALYLREYARQGPLVSLIRIAVNNLAGIPSIVYGVFGYGFFLSKVGVYIDQGPAAPASAGPWWWSLASAALLVGLAVALAAYARGQSDPKSRGRVRTLMGFVWLAAAGLAVWAIATTPYFGGLFREKLPSPTFGTRGLLWAALTLALLTLPVVIVATEEAIAAVPRSVREGSYGCGASKWQTIKRIVLPQALPGIMTGGILAMARGAGEVAPLMLVGAMKLAPELPIDHHFPYLHPERAFMHLGYHIYDLGFQSPDSEAARPLVWTTTLLLVSIVLVLNLGAVTARAKLRAKVVSASV
jgi:ABC-type phosphate transport system permease subunit